MKITETKITFELDHRTLLELEDGEKLRDMMRECRDAANYEVGVYVADRAAEDNPELMAELKEAMKKIRKLRTDMKETLLPLLRKLERAGRKAERAIDADIEAAE
jgi:hypothetical protein